MVARLKFWLLMLLLISGVPAQPPDHTALPFSLSKKSSWPAGSREFGFAHRVVLSGDHAFLADGEAGLRILKISESGPAQLVGHYDTPGVAYAVFVSDNFAYVADGVEGFHILDISDRSVPTWISSSRTLGAARNIFVSGSHAYVANMQYGVQIFHIADPRNPKQVGHLETPGLALATVVSNGVAYIADDTAGLAIFNVADPGHPNPLETWTNNSSVVDVVFSGRHVFLANGPGGFEILDIADPSRPASVLKDNLNADVRALHFDPPHLYCLATNRMIILNVSDLTSPRRVFDETIHAPALGIASTMRQLHVANGESGFTTYEKTLITDHSVEPILVGSWPGYVRGQPDGLVIRGHFAFAAAREGGLHVFDLTDSDRPRLVAGCDTPGMAMAVEVAGSFAFLAARNAGLQIINISDPMTPTLTGSYTATNLTFANHVSMAGDLAFVTDWSTGLHIIDVADKAMPKLVSQYPISEAVGSAVHGNIVYIAGELFTILNISDPSKPLQVQRANLFPTGEMIIQPPFVFVATKTGLAILKTVETGSASVHALLDIGAWTSDVSLFSNFALLTHAKSKPNAPYPEYPAGFQIVDLTNLKNPTVVATGQLGDYSGRSALLHDRAYITDPTQGRLYTVDIRAPADPRVINRLIHTYQSDLGSAHNIVVQDNYGYVADGPEGVRVLDLSNLSRPAEVGRYDPPDPIDGIQVQGAYAVARSAAGLHILDIAEPSAIHQLGFFDDRVTDFALVGNVIWATYGHTIFSVSLQNPANPVRSGLYSSPAVPLQPHWEYEYGRYFNWITAEPPFAYVGVSLMSAW